MKHWFCKFCGHRETTEDNIVIAICKSCVESMEREEEKDGNTN